MEDKLHNYFSENEFDFQEPLTGHLQRFEKRLEGGKSQKKTSWRWMSVAASVILIIGFAFGSMTNTEDLFGNDETPKIQEVESFFANTIQVELQEIEKNRSLETEKIIEKALDELEELEEDYNRFLEDLNNTGEQRSIINEMITNYQKRLDVLNNALVQIDLVKNPKIIEEDSFL